MELPIYVLLFILLTQRYIPTLFRLSSIILGLSKSALIYVTTGLTLLVVTSERLFRSILLFNLEQVAKDAYLIKKKLKFVLVAFVYINVFF